MQLRFQKIITVISILYLYPFAAVSDEPYYTDRALHFDQPQSPLNSLNFKHDNELRPSPNDFRLIEAYFLSNNIGERWAVITIENTSPGKRFLKNEFIIATFANGNQTTGFNLNETLKSNERLTKSVFFGIHQFPVVNIKME